MAAIVGVVPKVLSEQGLRQRFSASTATCTVIHCVARVTAMSETLVAYARTLGWALVGALSMGIGLIVTLKLFTLSTPSIDEWQEIKRGNMAMALVLASVVV